MQREIGIIIKVKDAAKAKEEIKGIIDNKILGNVKKFKEGMGEAGTSVKRAGKAAAEARGSFDKLFSKMTTGMGAIYALKRGFSFAMDSFEQGAGLERAAVQFESSIGKVDKFLPTLRAATRGTVDDMKLLATANRAVMEGLDPRQLAATYKMATVASRKLGLDTETSIQTISNAIVRQEESALTTLGTILKTNIKYKIQNALIAKNAGVMSGAMAVAIRQSVIMEELNRKFGGFNKLQEDGTEILQRFRASIDNLKMALGQALGTALAPMLKGVTYLAEGFTNLLNKVKDNIVFKSFLKTLVAVGVYLAGSKLVAGLLLVTKAVIALVGGIKLLAIVAAGTVGLTFLSMGLDAVKDKTSVAGSAIRGFYDLISNFDYNTGLSSMLKEDKDALGSWFPIVKVAAQSFLWLKAGVIGAWEGIRDSTVSATRSIIDSMSMIISKGKEIPFIGTVFALIEAPVRALSSAFTSLGNAIARMMSTLSLTKLKHVQELVRKAADWANPLNLVASAAKGTADATSSAASFFSADNLRASPEEHAKSPYARTDIEVAPRAQNIDHMSQPSPELMQLLKETKLTRESNQQMNSRDEQKESNRRTQSFSR